LKWFFKRSPAPADRLPKEAPEPINSIQLHDLFDRSYGRSVDNCAELLDWPGKTTPFTGRFLDEELGRTSDWQQASRIATQVKLGVYVDELVKANPKVSHLKDAGVVFVMASKELTKALHTGPTGVVLVDALWLSFANFAIQSLFATFPHGETEEILKSKQHVSIHFAFRALLYLEILRGKKVDRPRFQMIWETWPNTWDIDQARLIFIWTAIGRFLVAHELAHLALHGEGKCNFENVASRELIPRSWKLSDLIEALGPETVSRYIFEVEADMMALELCDGHASAVSEEARRLVMGSVYYLFLCLCELERRVGDRRFFEPRMYGIRAWIRHHPLGSDSLLANVDEQFAGRAKFYFELASMLPNR
jgi:hypothetical protein